MVWQGFVPHQDLQLHYFSGPPLTAPVQSSCPGRSRPDVRLVAARVTQKTRRCHPTQRSGASCNDTDIMSQTPQSPPNPPAPAKFDTRIRYLRVLVGSLFPRAWTRPKGAGAIRRTSCSGAWCRDFRVVKAGCWSCGARQKCGVTPRSPAMRRPSPHQLRRRKKYYELCC